MKPRASELKPPKDSITTEERQVLFAGEGSVLSSFLLLAELSGSKRLAGEVQVGGGGRVDDGNLCQSGTDSVAAEVGTKITLVWTAGWSGVTGLDLGGDAEGGSGASKQDFDLVVAPGSGKASKEAAGEKVRRREIQVASTARREVGVGRQA